MPLSGAAANAVPTLETARLVLRGHRLDDFSDIAAMWADAGVTRFIGGQPFTREEAWARLLRQAGHWSLLGFGYWAAEEKSSGRFTGQIGFGTGKRELGPHFDEAPEIGWALAPWAHGKGFATEAAQAVVAWGDGHFGGARTVCMIEPGNSASVGVAQKCGYTEYAQTEYKGHPTILFERQGK
jgi:RimJ/RimL family protein N-acetyltransferase